MDKKRAFSLVELSVVVIIIGILIAGVTQGVGMIKVSRLANARSLTSKSIVPEIDGLVAWYETSLQSSFKSSEALDGTNLTTWYDISPASIANGRNILTKTAASDATYQASGINKIPSINFSSSGKFTLTNFYQGNSAQATVFLVFEPTSSPNSTQKIIFDSYYGTGYSDLPSAIGIKNNTVHMNGKTSVDTLTSTNPASFVAGKDYILAGYFNDSYSKAFVNDATSMIGGSTINLNVGTNKQLSGLTIGTSRYGRNPFDGFVSEVIIYNRPLQLQERKDVMKYLARKYQISVKNL